MSCPPYLLIAHILGIDNRIHPPLVSYRFQDDDGLPIESVEYALLNDGWWKTFQPMPCRRG